MSSKSILPSAALLFLVACSDLAIPPPPKAPAFGQLRPPVLPWTGDIASGWFKSPLPAGDAQRILQYSKLFALGDMPPKRQVQAFNVIFDQSDAVPVFRYIAAHAEPAGRLYALAALSVLAPPEAAALRETLAHRSDEIVVLDSDVVDRQPIAAIVLLIEQRRLGVEFRRLRNRTYEYFERELREPDAIISSTGEPAAAPFESRSTVGGPTALATSHSSPRQGASA